MTTAAELYGDIAERTGGTIYLGVSGPVRTGKSTFVKRVMETFVIPNIENIYRRERAIDELPQSSSGRTIMTSEPKFVPEEAVEISPDGTARFSIRLIDSVGYLIPGAIGAEEEGAPRMVTTPWYPEPIPMAQAAELGTAKIMSEHCTMGIVITTDGTIHDIPREEFLQAEERAIADMKATGKPFLVLVNSTDPTGAAAQAVRTRLDETFGIPCLCVNCLLLQEGDILEIFSALLREFPVSEVRIALPRWFGSLPQTHPLKNQLYQALLQQTKALTTIREATEALAELQSMESVDALQVSATEPGTGVIHCDLRLREDLFYQILSDQTGFSVETDGDLLQIMVELAEIKRNYAKVSDALEQVQATGYGVVLPSPEEMMLEQPEIVRKGSNYAVRLKAVAPSIHMLRTDIETEISPMIGEEKQSEDILQYLMEQSQGNVEQLWTASIFGKTVEELVREGLGTKLRRMSDGSRRKFQSTFSKIVNEGSSGLICIILP